MDWERFDALTDEEIRAAIESDPDAPPPLNEEFWKNARMVWPVDEENKQKVSIRLDADVARWLRRQKGVDERINAMLRADMLEHGG